MDTPECRSSGNEDVAKFGEDTQWEGRGQPEEIAPAYVFFPSNADSSFVSGEVLTLLGGRRRPVRQ